MAGDEFKPDGKRQRLYHGTRVDLKPGDLIAPGYASNYGKQKKATYVYLTGTLDAAIWGAELAYGEGPGGIYIVEPTGPIMDDPNLTDKKYPGNPTKSYRSRQPLRVVGEITEWQGHSPERLQAMKDHIERLRQLGVEAIDDWVHSFTTVRCLAAVFEEKTQHLARSVWSSRIGVGARGAAARPGVGGAMDVPMLKDGAPARVGMDRAGIGMPSRDLSLMQRLSPVDCS